MGGYVSKSGIANVFWLAVGARRVTSGRSMCDRRGDGEGALDLDLEVAREGVCDGALAAMREIPRAAAREVERASGL